MPNTATNPRFVKKEKMGSLGCSLVPQLSFPIKTPSVPISKPNKK
jgi:hypothetical protein